ncbi:MAG: FAD-dependent oxidoreductase [Desulfobacula sp.]|uniref:protoporphyrinogen/coproporphyrinogen oxidase n=1 Tax=Desulfobacula sp. TaxID=2593537 RepID=UPI0025BE109E|nr:FAD-dependent oxidoreductase [Desulfobacula sp.]MCD4722715.1 FAD-dependent oxidoreductase [Desulfobacula sp.]
MRIVILGGGPTGLGAAWRLNELDHDDWVICEANDYWGGLAASFQDDRGFVWDFGGHVLFSHYQYFDTVMDTLFKASDGWLVHNREAWIWMQDRFVSYPLQNNIHKLPEQVYWECLEGIIDIQNTGSQKKPKHFGQWIQATFGQGLAKWFLDPYNYKVWAYPTDHLGWSWVGERVAPVALKQILKNAVFQNNDTQWGPNSRFRFPANGGTGAIWKEIALKLPPKKARLNKKVVAIDTKKRVVSFSDQRTENYDILLNTLPLTDFIRLADFEGSLAKVPVLKYSSTHVVGLALKGKTPETLASKCWIYFPENNCPFYRVTVFSNYSPNNVPDIGSQWSLMCEVSESSMKKVDASTVVEDVIQGALNTGLIRDRKSIDHTWYRFEKKAYPTPSITRDEYLVPLSTKLFENNIYSRGRFGAWKYEVGNMDHSFMQGVEFVNTCMGYAEEITLWYPDIVNKPHPGGKKR